MKPAQKISINHDARHAIFLELIGLLWDLDGQGMKAVAESAGVHWTTIYDWRNAETMSPRIDTLTAVAEVFGYEPQWVKIQKGRRPKLSVIK